MMNEKVKQAINAKLDSIFIDAVNMPCPAKCVLVDRYMCYLTWPADADCVVTPELFKIMVFIISCNFADVEVVDSPKYRADKNYDDGSSIEDIFFQTFHLN